MDESSAVMVASPVIARPLPDVHDEDDLDVAAEVYDELLTAWCALRQTARSAPQGSGADPMLTLVKRAVMLLGRIDLALLPDAIPDSLPALAVYQGALAPQHPWRGRVLLYAPMEVPPECWAHRLVSAYLQGSVTDALVVAPADRSASWLQTLPAGLRCATLRLSSRGDERHVVVYIGRDPWLFNDCFADIGTVTRLGQLRQGSGGGLE